jgi:hypothetical protein
VKVCVKRNQKTITWKINNFIEATLIHDILLDKNRIFMPYVEMYDIGDKI